MDFETARNSNDVTDAYARLHVLSKCLVGCVVFLLLEFRPINALCQNVMMRIRESQLESSFQNYFH